MLQWTNGAIRGHMWKSIWSGTWSSGQTGYITELPRYNLLVLILGGAMQGQRIPVWRHPSTNTTYSWSGAGSTTYNSNTTFYVLVAGLSGTSTRLDSGSDWPAVSMSFTGSGISGVGGHPVVEIFGVI